METKKLFFTFKVILKILPKHHSAVLYAILGYIYFQRGLYQDSEKFFKKSIACQMPSNVHRDFGYAGLGKIYLRKGLISEAIKNFNVALEFNPKSTFAYEGLGAIYDSCLNDRDNAIFYYKKFFASGGGSDKIEERLKELEKEVAKDE